MKTSESNDLWFILEYAKKYNLELRQKLPIIRIGKKKIIRWKVLNKPTNQLQLI